MGAVVAVMVSVMGGTGTGAVVEGRAVAARAAAVRAGETAATGSSPGRPRSQPMCKTLLRL